MSDMPPFSLKLVDLLLQAAIGPALDEGALSRLIGRALSFAAHTST